MLASGLAPGVANAFALEPFGELLVAGPAIVLLPSAEPPQVESGDRHLIHPDYTVVLRPYSADAAKPMKSYRRRPGELRQDGIASARASLTRLVVLKKPLVREIAPLP